MLDIYIDRLRHLQPSVSRTRWSEITRHSAPHKPLLLLAVLDLFAEGSIPSNLIEITPELGELFTLYWARVMPPDQRGYLHLPFFHLGTEKKPFWHLVPQPDKKAFLQFTRHVKSLNQLRDIAIGARLDDELYELLCVETSRNVLRTVLIEKYFAPEVRAGLMEQGMINVEAYEYSQELLKQARTQQPLKEADHKLSVRDQGFRRAIVIAYEHRCAFCGIRMMTPDGHSVVDAAHIIPWSVSHNDNPRNGMALCKLCHWTYDEGLVGVSQKYLVITSPQLGSNHNIPAHLSTLTGRAIFRPNEEVLWPDLAGFLWHHKEVFRNR